MTETTTVRKSDKPRVRSWLSATPRLFGASPEFWAAWWAVTLENWPLRWVSSQQLREMQ